MGILTVEAVDIASPTVRPPRRVPPKTYVKLQRSHAAVVNGEAKETYTQKFSCSTITLWPTNIIHANELQ